MKRIFATILLAGLLAGCGQQQPTPTATSTPEPTTPPVPTNTVIPTATMEPWMQSLPDGVVSVQKDGDTLVGLDADGNPVQEFDLDRGEWKEVEPMSAEELEKKMNGMSVSEAMEAMKEYCEFNPDWGDDGNSLDAGVKEFKRTKEYVIVMNDSTITNAIGHIYEHVKDQGGCFYLKLTTLVDGVKADRGLIFKSRFNGEWVWIKLGE